MITCFEMINEYIGISLAASLAEEVNKSSIFETLADLAITWAIAGHNPSLCVVRSLVRHGPGA